MHEDLHKIKTEKQRIVLTTYGYSRRGVSFPNMTAEVLASSRRNGFMQIGGRIERQGSDTSIRRVIVDFVDVRTSLHSQHRDRKHTFEMKGYKRYVVRQAWNDTEPPKPIAEEDEAEFDIYDLVDHDACLEVNDDTEPAKLLAEIEMESEPLCDGPSSIPLAPDTAIQPIMVAKSSYPKVIQPDAKFILNEADTLTALNDMIVRDSKIYNEIASENLLEILKKDHIPPELAVPNSIVSVHGEEFMEYNHQSDEDPDTEDPYSQLLVDMVNA